MKHKDAVPPSSEKRGFTGQKPENRGKGFHVKRVVVFLAVAFVLTWAYEFVVVYPPCSRRPCGAARRVDAACRGRGDVLPGLGGGGHPTGHAGEGFKNAVLKPRRFKQAFPWFAVAWLGPSVLVALGAGVYFLCFPGDFSPGMDYVVAATQQALAAQGAPGPSTPTSCGYRSARRLWWACCWAASSISCQPSGRNGDGADTWCRRWPAACASCQPCWSRALFGDCGTRPSPPLGTTTAWGIRDGPSPALPPCACSASSPGSSLPTSPNARAAALRRPSGIPPSTPWRRRASSSRPLGATPSSGPGPTGIVGGCAFVVVAALMLWDLHRREKAGTLRMPQAGLPDVTTKADLARGATTPDHTSAQR